VDDGDCVEKSILTTSIWEIFLFSFNLYLLFVDNLFQ
jgi:hypothetical protein